MASDGVIGEAGEVGGSSKTLGTEGKKHKTGSSRERNGARNWAPRSYNQPATRGV